MKRLRGFVFGPDSDRVGVRPLLRALAAVLGLNALVVTALLLAHALPFAPGAASIVCYFAAALRLEALARSDVFSTERDPSPRPTDADRAAPDHDPA